MLGRDADLARLIAALRGPAQWVTLVGLPGVGKRTLARAALREVSDVVLAEPHHPFSPALDRTVLALAFAPLRVPGEHVVRLAPLPVPSADAAADDVLASHSVRALIMAAERSGQAIDARAQVDALRAIVRRASGIPLALEIVAASLALAPLDAIARSLRRPARLAVPGKPSLGEVMRELFDSLDADARSLLVRIAPHRAGWEIDTQAALALPALRTLVDHGLAERVSATAAAVRFRAPELVAAIALELAMPEEAAQARREHAAAIDARTRAAERAVRRAGDADAQRELEAQRDDVDAAMETITDDAETIIHVASAALRIPGFDLDRLDGLRERSPPDVRAGVLLARATRGGARDPLALLDQARALATDSAIVAKIALARGFHLQNVRRDYAAATRAFEEATRSPDELVRGRALISLGGASAWQERFEDALSVFERARAELASMGSPRLEAIVLTNIALARSGHWPSPRSIPPRTRELEDTRRAIAMFESIGDPRGVAYARQHHALTLVSLLRFEEARRVSMEALPSASDPLLLAMTHANLGDLAFVLGDPALAAREHDEARRIADGAGDALVGAAVRAGQADAAVDAGQIGRARELFRDARELLSSDDAHSTRLALVMGNEALLASDEEARSLLERARAIAGEEGNAHRHALSICAAAYARRVKRPDRDAELAVVVPWARACASLMHTRPSDRGSDGHGAPWAVWVALRRFVRVLDPHARRVFLDEVHGPDVLIVDLDRRAVRLPEGGPWVDLSRRERPFALLASLVGLPWERAHRVWSVAELVDAVWPGEKMLPEAGANRVYAATALLRKHLPGVVAREDEGYRISAGLDVMIVRDGYIVDPSTP